MIASDFFNSIGQNPKGSFRAILGCFASDCVAKLKNELTAKFRAAPVGPDICQSNASQGAYEGCRLKIELIM
jgi:hypothetical protein